MSESTKKRKRESTIIHGRPHKFFKGGTSTFCLSFTNCWLPVFPLRSFYTLTNVCFSEHDYFRAEYVEFSMNYKLCELHIKYTILSKYEQNTHFIQIAPCFRWRVWNFDGGFGMLQVRENETQQCWWSWVFAHLIGNIADDAMQMDVHKTLYPSYSKKKVPHVTVTITKKRFVGSNSQIY